jgi:amidohydrolase
MNIKENVRQHLNSIQKDLIELSHKIHAAPELAFKEEQAAEWLTDILNKSGFKVEKGICNLPTAFKAQKGSGFLHITLCAEYDALPEIGHACGHNIIAAATVGAAIAIAPLADELGLTVTVIGTPAEENGGGKILLLERGAFANSHAAMMVHPAHADILLPEIIAATLLEFFYTGKEAHASMSPQSGINAADALTVAQVAIGLLRQHIHATDRIHGIITKGGDAPNVIPAHTAAKYLVRTKNIADLENLAAKVIHCFEAGAVATGATLNIIRNHKPYAHMQHDLEIATLYQQNAETLGRRFVDPNTLEPGFMVSTDMGNISLEIPSIHPTIGLDSLPAINHQPEFTTYCASKTGDQAVLDGALAMAWTIIDIATNTPLKERLLKTC